MDRDDSRRLLSHGVLLFLLGLMSGFVIPFMVNRRMGLSDHLIGTLGGTFLGVLGLMWSHLRLSKGLLKTTFGSRCMAHMRTGSPLCWLRSGALTPMLPSQVCNFTLSRGRNSSPRSGSIRSQWRWLSFAFCCSTDSEERSPYHLKSS
jgi:hypothetical protein